MFYCNDPKHRQYRLRSDSCSGSFDLDLHWRSATLRGITSFQSHCSNFRISTTNFSGVQIFQCFLVWRCGYFNNWMTREVKKLTQKPSLHGKPESISWSTMNNLLASNTWSSVQPSRKGLNVSSVTPNLSTKMSHLMTKTTK